MTASDLSIELTKNIQTGMKSLLLRGGSCVVAPDGSFVIEPVFDREKILTAEIDLY